MSSSVEELRTIALSLPNAVEKDHMGRPSFRINDKIFATLWPKQNKCVFKLSKANQEALLMMQPETFSENSWSKHGWTDVNLATIESEQLQQLAYESWRLVGPA